MQWNLAVCKYSELEFTYRPFPEKAAAYMQGETQEKTHFPNWEIGFDTNGCSESWEDGTCLLEALKGLFEVSRLVLCPVKYMLPMRVHNKCSSYPR